MGKIIRIAALDNRFSRQAAAYSRSRLATIGAAAEIVKTDSATIEAVERALLWGEADMAVIPMPVLSSFLPEGLVITAVSERSNPAEWLLVRPGAKDEGLLFGLKEGALVYAQSARRQAQMLDLKPGIRFSDDAVAPDEVLEQLLGGTFDAAILPAAELEDLPAEIHVVRFNPKEFVPAPGQGVLAYLTGKEDLHTRRLLKGIHHPEVSETTNIERGIFRLLGGDPNLPLGVYAETDSQGNRHVWAAFSPGGNALLRRVRLSSSTSFQLAERVAEQLKG